MNPKKPITVSIRIREDTYAKIAMDGVKNNVKSVDVVEAMATLWFELTPTERAMRLGNRPVIESQTSDSGGQKMGSYLSTF
jgi:hypothetical protein